MFWYLVFMTSVWHYQGPMSKEMCEFRLAEIRATAKIAYCSDETPSGMRRR